MELPTKNYSKKIARELFEDGKMEEAIKYIKSYMYVIENPEGAVLFWKAAFQRFEMLKDIDAYKAYIPKAKCVKKIGKIKAEYLLRTEFIDSLDDFYHQTCDFQKPISFECNEQLFVNRFTGGKFKNSEGKKFTECSKYAKEGVNFIWHHVKDILCSGNSEQYDILKNWTIRTVNNIKNDYAVYLKSGQGTGKSIFAEFICYSVMGKNIILKTNNATQMLHEWNGELIGKSCIVFEEMANDSVQQWHSNYNAIKDWITGYELTIKQKFMHNFQLENAINIWVITNLNALSLEQDDRRFFCPDISSKMVGNKEYFKKLAEYTHSEEVSECFYLFCKQSIDTEFYEQHRSPMMTNTKAEIVNENINPVLKYIRDDYVLKGNKLDIKYSEFFDDYAIWYNNKFHKELPSSVTKQSLSDIFEKHDIQFKMRHNNRYLDMSFEDLYNLYLQKQWINKFDEAPTPKDVKEKNKNVKVFIEDEDLKNVEKLNSNDKIKLMKKLLSVLTKNEKEKLDIIDGDSDCENFEKANEETADEIEMDNEDLQFGEIWAENKTYNEKPKKNRLIGTEIPNKKTLAERIADDF
jgi:hypothetical protein